MKNVIRKWWFWLIVIIAIIIIIICVKNYIDNKEMERKFSKMGEGTSEYYKGTKEAEGYLNKFTYNYSTGTVDYNK